MSNDFAVIINHDEIGQVLIERYSNQDNNPSVVISFMICDFKLGPQYSWHQTAEGVQSRNEFWERIQKDREYFDKFVLPLYEGMKADISKQIDEQDADR